MWKKGVWILSECTVATDNIDKFCSILYGEIFTFQNTHFTLSMHRYLRSFTLAILHAFLNKSHLSLYLNNSSQTHTPGRHWMPKSARSKLKKNTLYLCSPEDDTSSQQTPSSTDTYLQQAYISHVNTWKHLKGRKKVFCRLPREGDSSHIKIDVVWNREQTGSDRDQTGSQPSRLWAPRPFYNDLRFNLQYDWRHSL